MHFSDRQMVHVFSKPKRKLSEWYSKWNIGMSSFTRCASLQIVCQLFEEYKPAPIPASYQLRRKRDSRPSGHAYCERVPTHFHMVPYQLCSPQQQVSRRGGQSTDNCGAGRRESSLWHSERGNTTGDWGTPYYKRAPTSHLGRRRRKSEPQVW